MANNQMQIFISRKEKSVELFQQIFQPKIAVRMIPGNPKRKDMALAQSKSPPIDRIPLRKLSCIFGYSTDPITPNKYNKIPAVRLWEISFKKFRNSLIEFSPGKFKFRCCTG
jgi:hypothetical protein